MSFLTLEFVILFLKVLNIDFPLILISLNKWVTATGYFSPCIIIFKKHKNIFFAILKYVDSSCKNEQE